MAKQQIDLGTVNDPLTGDTLYVGGGKINANMVELDSELITINGRIDANDSKTSLEDDSVVEARLGTQYKGGSALATDDVDWLLSQVYTKTLIADTVLTFSNIYIGVKDLEITGNFTLGLPAGFTVINGTYDGTVNNLIEVICTNQATPTGWVVISQAS